MNKEQEHSENKKSIGIEGLPKENIFKVPERYFDELPGIIQSRVTRQSSIKWWQEYFTPANSWKVALATIVVSLIVVFSGVFTKTEVANNSVEDILASVSLDDLIEYVEYSDISTEEILAELDLSEYEIDFLMGEDIKLIDDSEFENLDAIDLYEIYGIEDELY